MTYTCITTCHPRRLSKKTLSFQTEEIPTSMPRNIRHPITYSDLREELRIELSASAPKAPRDP
jgi:hypothetical protein